MLQMIELWVCGSSDCLALNWAPICRFGALSRALTRICHLSLRLASRLSVCESDRVPAEIACLLAALMRDAQM
jgi:hypothetical protein